NKTDLVTPATVGMLKATLKKLNPGAKIIESSFSKVNPDDILNTGLFNPHEAEQSPAWQEELEKGEHTPETEEYGISSFVYRSRKPFDPIRFWDYIRDKFPVSIIRSKGMFWLASRPEQALVWGQAGGSLRADSAGLWWHSLSVAERMTHPVFIENQIEIEENWHTQFGDRHNEIVFIGQNMDKELISKELDACLVTDLELATELWREGYEDEWPVQRIHAV
ncbi:MAG: GTP-binding protein, partial [Saprospiraceae bacterium]|nr:GTP-binding protein [Saprospiraceae bacterium]